MVGNACVVPRPRVPTGADVRVAMDHVRKAEKTRADRMQRVLRLVRRVMNSFAIEDGTGRLDDIDMEAVRLLVESCTAVEQKATPWTRSNPMDDGPA
jgi:hypothetical protein